MISSVSTEKNLPWQELQPQLNLQQLATEPCQFFDLQPQATKAIKHFLANKKRHLMVLKADNQSEYAPLLEHLINQQLPPATEAINYLIEQGDSFSFPRVLVEKVNLPEQNIKPVATLQYLDQFQLFGSIRIHHSSKDIQLSPGLIHHLNNGVLIISVSALLAQFDLWLRLKQIAETQQLHWFSAHPFKSLPCEIPSCPLKLKIILMGSRAELTSLSELEENLYKKADYAEIESYYFVQQPSAQQQWASYILTLATEQGIQLDLSAINKIYQLAVRESEDRYLISISPQLISNWLNQTQLISQTRQLEALSFENFFQQQQKQQGFLREQAYADILNEQVFVATEGEVVGQINGLSVIEYPGTPISFGEPSRISCIVQFGEGEVIDVERKSELAGNIHGKGMMIAQSCLANLLNLPSQLPFSASLVFEQSYNEVDGDSASLASFCVLVSSLSNLPLPQSIAITGAIDQFGLVHAVGGINDKVEGFFEICQRRGLTGKQGVILPTASIQQLSLGEKVVEAVKNQQFFIFSVEDVFQACELLFARDLVEEENTDQPTIAQLIQQRIEYRNESLQPGLILKLCRWFKK